MLTIRKLFKFPKPSFFNKEAKGNALQSRRFSPETSSDVYCWEDYYNDLKKAYPVRYFLAETLPDYLLFNIWYPIARPISDLYYWFVSHVVPSRRYHMLDLRQPDTNCDIYRYGWRDTDSRMLYALFNLLNEFVEQEFSNLYCPTEEECSSGGDADIPNREQRNTYFEIIDLHDWWNNKRKRDYAFISILQNAWHDRKYKRKIFDAETARLWDELQKANQSFDEKEEEMVTRLLKIRKRLWT